MYNYIFKSYILIINLPTNFPIYEGEVGYEVYSYDTINPKYILAVSKLKILLEQENEQMFEHGFGGKQTWQ